VHNKINKYNNKGKGQSVENQNVESPKTTSKVQKEHQKSKNNIESPKTKQNIKKGSER
jgi:hypothetical protein